MNELYSLPLSRFHEIVLGLIPMDRRFTYVKTLANKMPDYSIDMLKALPVQNKKMRDFLDAVSDHREEIESALNTESASATASSARVYIPYSQKSDSTSDMLTAFVDDFIMEFSHSVQSRPPKDMDKYKRMIESFLMCYQTGARMWSDKEIANKQQVRSETVRTDRIQIASMAIGLFSSKKTTIQGIAASGKMHDVYGRFLSDLKPVELLTILQRRTGLDSAHLSFYLDANGYSQSQIFCVRNDLFWTSALTFLNKNHGKLVQFISDSAVPIRFETDVDGYMANDFGWNPEERELMTGFLKADSDRFEWSGPDPLGYHQISLKWACLKSTKSREIRILYNRMVNNPNNPCMTRAALIDEYNKLALLDGGIKPLKKNAAIEFDEHIYQHGNGLYQYNTGSVQLLVDKSDLTLELRKLVDKNGGGVLLGEAMQFARKINPTYSENTVQSYLRNIGCVQQKDKSGATWFVDKNRCDAFISKLGKIGRRKQPDPALEIETSARILLRLGRHLNIKKELLNEFLKKNNLNPADVNPQAFANTLHKADGIVFSFPSETPGSIKLILTGDELETVDWSQFKRKAREESDRTREIRIRAAEALYYSPGYTLTKKALFDVVKNLYPKNSDNNIYKIFATDDLLISDGRGKAGSYTLDIDKYCQLYGITADSSAQRVKAFTWEALRKKILSRLNEPMLNETISDRMYEIMQQNTKAFDASDELWQTLKLLDMCIEGKGNDNEKELLVIRLYISIEIFLKRYKPVYATADAGLGKYIGALQAYGYLPDRNQYHIPGSPAYELDRTTGLIITNRNNICHTLKPEKNGKVVFDKHVNTVLRYLLFVAAYDMEKRGVI